MTNLNKVSNIQQVTTALNSLYYQALKFTRIHYQVHYITKLCQVHMPDYNTMFNTLQYQVLPSSYGTGGSKAHKSTEVKSFLLFLCCLQCLDIHQGPLAPSACAWTGCQRWGSLTPSHCPWAICHLLFGLPPSDRGVWNPTRWNMWLTCFKLVMPLN